MESKRLLFLIVEDELIIAAHLESILQKHKWEVVDICSEASVAIEQITILQPDLVLIDINLKGGGNGIDIGRFLQRKGTPPFFYITSSSDKATLGEAQSTNPLGFIDKPFTEESIITPIEIAFHANRGL